MAFDALLQGKLLRPAEQRTGASGKPFVLAQMSVAVEGDESALLASLICFRDSARAALLALGAGDSLAVAGRAKINTWPDKATGEPKHGLNVVAEHVLTAYHVKHRRDAMQDARERPTGDARESDGTTPAPRRQRVPEAVVGGRRPSRDRGDFDDLGDDL